MPVFSAEVSASTVSARRRVRSSRLTPDSFLYVDTYTRVHVIVGEHTHLKARRRGRSLLRNLCILSYECMRLTDVWAGDELHMQRVLDSNDRRGLTTRGLSSFTTHFNRVGMRRCVRNEICRDSCRCQSSIACIIIRAVHKSTVHRYLPDLASVSSTKAVSCPSAAPWATTTEHA
jgi:hypothetical protein